MLIGFIFQSCYNYVQVFEVINNKISHSDGTLFFENDSLKIAYSFWKENGKLQYEILNKLDVPLLIDWKKSAITFNGKKYDYWIDIERKIKKGKINQNQLLLSDRNSKIIDRKLKRKRVFYSNKEYEFIPPSSTYTFTFDLSNLTKSLFLDYKEARIVEDEENKNRNFKFQRYQEYFDENYSSFYLTNFLTLSVKNLSDDNFYLNHVFYLHRIEEMIVSDFEYFLRDENNKYIKDNKGYKVVT